MPSFCLWRKLMLKWNVHWQWKYILLNIPGWCVVFFSSMQLKNSKRKVYTFFNKGYIKCYKYCRGKAFFFAFLLEIQLVLKAVWWSEIGCDQSGLSQSKTAAVSKTKAVYASTVLWTFKPSCLYWVLIYTETFFFFYMGTAGQRWSIINDVLLLNTLRANIVVTVKVPNIKVILKMQKCYSIKIDI